MKVTQNTENKTPCLHVTFLVMTTLEKEKYKRTGCYWHWAVSEADAQLQRKGENNMIWPLERDKNSVCHSECCDTICKAVTI